MECGCRPALHSPAIRGLWQPPPTLHLPLPAANLVYFPAVIYSAVAPGVTAAGCAFQLQLAIVICIMLRQVEPLGSLAACWVGLAWC